MITQTDTITQANTNSFWLQLMILIWWVMSTVNCPWNIQTGSKISEHSVTVSEVVPSKCSRS